MCVPVHENMCGKFLGLVMSLCMGWLLGLGMGFGFGYGYGYIMCFLLQRGWMLAAYFDEVVDEWRQKSNG